MRAVANNRYYIKVKADANKNDCQDDSYNHAEGPENVYPYNGSDSAFDCIGEYYRHRKQNVEPEGEPRRLKYEQLQAYANNKEAHCGP